MTENFITIINLIAAFIALITAIIGLFDSKSHPTATTNNARIGTTVNHFSDNRTTYNTSVNVQSRASSNNDDAILKLIITGVITVASIWLYFEFYYMLNTIVGVLTCIACLLFFVYHLQVGTTRNEIVKNTFVFLQPIAMSLANRSWQSVEDFNYMMQLFSEHPDRGLYTLIKVLFESKSLYTTGYFLFNIAFVVAMIIFLTIFIIELLTRNRATTFSQKVNVFCKQNSLPWLPYLFVLSSLVMRFMCEFAQ